MKRTAICLGLVGAIITAAVPLARAQTEAAPSEPAPSGLKPTTSPASVSTAKPVASASPTAAGGTVKTGTTAPSGANTQEMAPIIVTGSAIPTTDTEGAAPVQVIDSATIEKRGYQTVQDVLQNLPANGSGSSAGRASNSFAAGGAYVSLRGLGPQATLVLVNGRRVTDYAQPANGQYAFVDVNNIPAQIVDRVEVLTEGTALYGADAVAGVVNIITKRDLGSENGEFDLYVGNTDNHDALYQRYTLMGSLSSFDKNGYGLVEVDYQHQNSILDPDRQVSRTADQSVNGGFDLRSSRTYPGDFIGEDSGNNFSIAPGVGNVPLNSTVPGTPGVIAGGEQPPFDYNKFTSIVPETERYGVYMNYTYKFYDGNIVPNIDFDYRHNRTITENAPDPYHVGDGVNLPENNPNDGTPELIVPTTNPYNHTGEAIDIFAIRFVGLGPRIADIDGDVFRVVPSVDFKLGDGWTLNVGFNYNYSFLDDRENGYVSAAQFQNELNSTNLATAYNPFTSAGNQRGNVLNNLLVESGERDTSSLIGEDFRFNGKLFDLPAGPVQIAFGGDNRLDRYNQTHASADEAGDVLGGSIQLDTHASRKELSGYTELEIPLTSPSFNIPGFYSVSVDAAARVDKYSTFGSTENPQVSLRWETIPGLVIRGSYARSFRAPGLPELFAGANQSVEEISDPGAGPIDPKTGKPTGEFRDVTINGGGNPALKPETAETFSAGVAYTPDFVKGLLITADFFKIRYSNQIMQQDAQNLIDTGSGQVVHNPDGTIASVTATYSNVAFSFVQGIDAGVSYVIGDPNVNYGQFTFAINGTYYLNYKVDDGTGITENVGEDSGGVGPYARYRQDASITWDFHNFSFTVANDFTSQYTDTSVAEFGLRRNVGDYVIFDLQAAYTFDKETVDKFAPGARENGFDWRNIVAGTRVAIGVNNVYDEQPPFTANTANTNGFDQSAADPTGRFIYGQLSKKF